MEQNIHNLFGEKEVPVEKVEAYGFNDVFDFKDNLGYPRLEVSQEVDIMKNPSVYALKIEKGKKTNYYAKVGHDGRLFDPLGMYTEGHSKKQMRHAGKPMWALKPVNKRVFDNYVEFLKTKNKAWINNAQRELI